MNELSSRRNEQVYQWMTRKAHFERANGLDIVLCINI